MPQPVWLEVTGGTMLTLGRILAPLQLAQRGRRATTSGTPLGWTLASLQFYMPFQRLVN